MGLILLLALFSMTTVAAPVGGTAPGGHHGPDGPDQKPAGLSDNDGPLLDQMTRCFVDRSQLIGLTYNYAKAAVDLRKENEAMQEALTSLQQQRTEELGILWEEGAQLRELVENLKGEYNALQKAHKDLLERHAVLESFVDGLSKDHSSLQRRYQRRVEDHSALTIQHAELRRDMAVLRQSHDTVLQEQDSLRSAHERSEETLHNVIEENGRLSLSLRNKRNELTSVYRAWEQDKNFTAEKVTLWVKKREEVDEKIARRHAYVTARLQQEKEDEVSGLLRDQDRLLEHIVYLEKNNSKQLREKEDLLALATQHEWDKEQLESYYSKALHECLESGKTQATAHDVCIDGKGCIILKDEILLFDEVMPYGEDNQQ